MLVDYKLGQTSIVLRVKLRNSTSASGAGITGITNASSGLKISTIADNEAAATAYTSAGSTVDTVTTLGTFATPTASHCNFKEVDAANHPGLYEIQLANARYSVASSKSLIVTISGVANLAECDVLVPLRSVDPYSAASFLTGVNGIAPPANWNLMVLDGSGRVDVSKIAGTAQTARDIGASVLLSAGAGAGQLDFTSGVVKANLAQILGTALTETAGQIAGAFKKFFNVAVPTLTTGGVDQTGDSFARLGAPVATVSGDIASVLAKTPDSAHYTNARGDKLDNLDATVNSRSTLGGVAQTGDAYARLGTPVLATVSLDIAEVAAETDAIAAVKAQTDKFLFDISNFVKSDAQALPNPAPAGYGGTGGGGGGTLYGSSGSILYTFTVFQPGGAVPVPGASVFVSSDSAGVNRSQAQTTDALGRVQFNLDPSTVYFWIQHPDWTFVNPFIEVVS